MITSFKCKETKGVWEGQVSHRLPRDIQDRAFKKLRQINAARTLEDLKNPPGNNLEGLKGDRKGYMSIRINKQWRVCFEWKDGGASDVAIIDYH